MAFSLLPVSSILGRNLVSHNLLQNNHGQKKQGWRETDSQKNRNVQISDQARDEENHSSEHLDDTHDEEVSSLHLACVSPKIFFVLFILAF